MKKIMFALMIAIVASTMMIESCTNDAKKEIMANETVYIKIDAVSKDGSVISSEIQTVR